MIVTHDEHEVLLAWELRNMRKPIAESITRIANAFNLTDDEVRNILIRHQQIGD